MKSEPHDSSFGHVTGTADFVDDRPFQAGELHVGIVYSPIARGKIRGIHAEKALKIPGVRVFTAKDLHHNRWGTIFQDQPVLADDEVAFVGEPIAIVSADTFEAMREARALVELAIDPLPPVLSIEEARKQDQFIGHDRTIERGDPDRAMRSAPHRVSGVLKIAGQEHFYLESQASIAYPGENGQIEVHSSSQHPTEVQHLVAHSLGLSYHQVVCVVKRMGGAFGGKESQAAPYATFASLVAQKTKRAARLVLNKDEDMLMTGKRNPFECHYEVGFDGEGRILSLIVEHYSDAGAYADLSTAIMERAMLHSDNAYYLPAARIRGRVCRTNHAPTTAFRGFGGPKGVAMIENAIEEIALTLGIDAYEVRRRNCYQEDRNVTPYGQVIEEEMLPKLFDELHSSSEYRKRREEIEAFNRDSKTHLRGLSLTAVKFGISFTTRFLNQASALVNIHMDGTLQVSTGATEMGQGVNTKIAQAVAEVFSLPINQVRLMPTSTEKIANTSPTAASSGSDLNGSAALLAAGILKKRLQLVADQVFKRAPEFRGRKTAGAGTVPEIVIDEALSAEHIGFQDGFVFDPREPATKRIPFQELLDEAYLNRVSLMAHGYYRYPGIHYNKETGKGHPFFYFTNGVAASEVSICRHTGELKVLRTDILMDLGRPLNEAIDHGQVTGAFIQGMGWVTTEKLHYDPKGRLVTISPSTYKIPSIQDIPRDFRVKLLTNDGNQKNFRGGKAVGEPPLLLCISVWTAVGDALSYALQGKPAKLPIPATQEEILMRLP